MKLTLGRATPKAAPVTVDKLRDARVAAARKHSLWTEIEEVDLVERGRFFVGASDDSLYRPYRGVVFASGSISIISERNPLCFTVGTNGTLRFYERLSGTWSEMLAKQARRRVTA